MFFRLSDVTTKRITPNTIVVAHCIVSLFTIGSFFLYIVLSLQYERFNYNSDFAQFMTGANIIKDGKTELLYDYETQQIYQTEVINHYIPLKQLRAFRSFPFVAYGFIPLSGFDFLLG